MRLFLAVDLDETVRRRAATWAGRLIERLGPKGAGEVKWVQPEQIHITLHFFGELQADEVSQVSRALTGGWDVAPFELRVSGSGCYPRNGPAKVVWLGLVAGNEELRQLHAGIQRRLEPLGLAEPAGSRPFSPHVTIGRVRKDAPSSLARHLREEATALDADIGRCTIDGVTLYQSRLSARGPTYTPLERFPL